MRTPARLFSDVLVVSLLCCSVAHQLHAQEAPDTARTQRLDSIVVTGRFDDLIGEATSASVGSTGARDLLIRPVLREGELMETIPGFIATQHSGDGKANQYFVRGFNLDHGTDFSTKVEGMPINMVSHAHGQGYTDINWIIPELVDRLDYKLGNYYAEVGDFGSAGAAEFHLRRKLARPFAVVTGGMFDLARVAAGGSVGVGGGDLLLGGEVRTYNGPWAVNQELRKLSGLARFSWGKPTSRFSLLGLAYHNDWNSSDQVPRRAVNDGLIDRFGQIDSTLGAGTQRYSLAGSWDHVGANSSQSVHVWGAYSDLSLFSNFTYLLDQPVRGDQFNQVENRWFTGGDASHLQPVRAFGAGHMLKVGLQTRADFIDAVSLLRTERREQFATIRQDDVTEWTTGLFLQGESRWTPRFRTVLGLRGDVAYFDVRSDIPANSGQRTAGLVSPKASLIFTPSAELELYLNGGFGFHSNDARGTTITVDPVTGDPADQVDPLVRSKGAEVGLRANPTRGWRSTIALWALNLDSELLFVGDAGITEPTFPSARQGVTWTNYYRIIPELSVDLDISFARARFRDVPEEENRIPGALENVIAAGITWNPVRPGFFGALRVRHFGAYPLIEDNSERATPTTLMNANVGYLFKPGIRLEATILNVFDSQDFDIQYFYGSRLSGETSAGIDDAHFHPVEPRQLRVSIIYGQ
jgi:hypothetical protein